MVGAIYAEPGVVEIAGAVDTLVGIADGVDTMVGIAGGEDTAAEELATAEELTITDDDPCASFPPGAKQFPFVGSWNRNPATVVTVIRSAGPGSGYKIAVPAMLRHSPSAICPGRSMSPTNMSG